MYILPVKCHLPYKSACVYFDSHGGRASSFISNVIFLINLPVCTLIAMGGGGGIILHVKCHLPYKSACVYFESHGGSLHVKCHLPYNSACVYFDSHGGSLHVKCHLPYNSACVYFDSQGGEPSCQMSSSL